MISTRRITAEEKEAGAVKGALLQAAINANALEPPKQPSEKVIPRTEMRLSAIVKNVGDVPSAPGRVFVQFGLPKPMDANPESVIFKTERVNLPSIEPGQYLVINFSKYHQWPSMFDFIRNEWAMREYQAIVDIDGKEAIAGTRLISFSAYYYEGRASEIPVRVTSANYTPSGNPRYSMSR
ncbi:MAG: hypothetical protein WB791_08885 [Waddliaceae bacterium]